MDDTIRDQIRTAFAELTGLMEDAAAVAAKGQHPGIDATMAQELGAAVQTLQNRASACLRAIEALPNPSLTLMA